MFTNRPVLRADAARNAERILRAAREVFAANGPDVPLEEIAEHAGVGIRTLFRRFPSKAELVRAALGQCIAEELEPAIQGAFADDNPLRGLTTVMEAAVLLAAREQNMLTAARQTGALTAVSAAFYEAVAGLARRAQDAGQIRSDLVADDLPRIMVMLISALWTMDPHAEGWRRYLTIVLDGLSPAQTTPLTPAAPFRPTPAGESRRT